MSASGRIEDLKKRYDENPRRFYAPLANEYRKSGDLEQAITLCETHLTDQLGTLNGHVVYGQALFDSGRFDEAERTFETALTFDPENLIALRHLGDIARTRGDTVQARSWYTRVLDADPRNHEMIALLNALPAVAAAPAARVPTPPREAPRVRTPDAPTPAVPMPRVAASRTPTPATATPAAPVAAPAAPPAILTMATPVMGMRSVATPIVSEPVASAPRIATPPVAAPAAPAAPEVPAAPRMPTPVASTPVVSTPTAPTPAVPTPVVPIRSVTPAASAPTAPNDFGLMDLSIDLDSFAGATVLSPDDFADVEFLFSTSDPAPEVAAPLAIPEEPVLSVFSDYHFGDAPLAPEPSEAGVVPELDSFVSSSPTPVEEMEIVSTVPDRPQPFVTETMAELYVQQGFRDAALDVYRQLLAQRPDDTPLKARVRSLEAARTPVAVVAVKVETAVEVESAVEVEAAVEVAVAVEVKATVFEAPPAIAAESPVPAAEAAPPAAEPAAPPPSRSARAFFGALAARRALRRDGTPPAGSPAPAMESSAGSGAASDAASATGPADGIQRGGTIDTMFGDTSVGAADEQVALSLANVAQGVESLPGIKGRPTKPATTELSLDAVFRETPSRARASVTPELGHMRYDQFFASSAGAVAASDASDAEAAPEPDDPRSPAELAQFQDWLQQLKKP
jgi:tetratricopeptide (TPR) repeat protein